ncbi:MAG: ERF family protein [Rhizomicrobium sp.]
MNAQTKIAEPLIFAKMVKIMQEIEAIGKEARNQAQGFNYRGIDDVYNALNPILARNGVFMTAHILEKSREERTNAKGTTLAFTCLRMAYSFTAEDGSSVTTEAEGEGMDSGDKSSNKAMAIAHKYALLQAFCVPTKDIVDPDADSHQITDAKPAGCITDAQRNTLQDMIVETGSDIEKFCQFFKISGINALPTNQYDRAVKMLVGKKKAV